MVKLKEERPDRQGYWWCWKEGMYEAVLRAFLFDCNSNIQCISESALKKYTHFALVERPDIPVPSRIQMFGELSGKPICFVDSSGEPTGDTAHYLILEMRSINKLFYNIPLKITLEREQG